MNVHLLGDRAFKRHLAEVLVRLRPRIHECSDEKTLLARMGRQRDALVILDRDFHVSADNRAWARFLAELRRRGARVVIVSSTKDPAEIAEAARLGSADYITRPYNHREFILRFYAVAQRKLKIACIGGGTGLFTLLLGLKTFPNALVSSVVNMADDGGSSGKLSQSFGILPPGDIRRSLVALSNAPEVMNQIMQHRFDKGDLQGHSFGNIFLTVLAEVKGNMSEAVRTLSDILNIQGVVLPATRTLTKLVARFQGGAVVRGESNIDLGRGRKPQAKVLKLWHEPPPECDADAYATLANADVIVIGPGDLYTSVVTTLAVPRIREAVTRSRALKIYVCNLMTKPGETWGLDAPAHAAEIVKYLGKDCLDAVVVSDTPLSREALEEYARKNQSPVRAGSAAAFRRRTRAKLVVADVGHETELVRHDSLKLRDCIAGVIAAHGGLPKPW